MYVFFPLREEKEHFSCSNTSRETSTFFLYLCQAELLLIETLFLYLETHLSIFFVPKEKLYIFQTCDLNEEKTGSRHV